MSTPEDPGAQENRLLRDMSGRAPAKPVEPAIPRVDLNRKPRRSWRPLAAALVALALVIGVIAYAVSRKDTQPAAAQPQGTSEQQDIQAATAAYQKYLDAETEAYKKYDPSIVQPYMEDDTYSDLASFIDGLKKDKLRLVGKFQSSVLKTKWSTADGANSVSLTACEKTGSTKLLDKRNKNVFVDRNGKPNPKEQTINISMRSFHGQPWRITNDYKVLAKKC